MKARKEDDDDKPKVGGDKKIVCENCDKSTQVDVPHNTNDDESSVLVVSSAAAPGQACRTSYEQVDRCMKDNKGQISKCVAQWNDFRKCHEGENFVDNVTKKAAT